VLLSVSRRTDIPAFYAAWFVRRLREGYFLLPNPRNPLSISRVAVAPETVEAVVFWSKNPRPLLAVLPEVDDLGYKYYLQFTLTPYSRYLESGLPDKKELAALFRLCGQKLGPERLVWRYDPIALGKELTAAWHRAAFRRLAEALSGYGNRCVLSFVDFYPKIAARLRAAGIEEALPEEMRSLMGELAGIARYFGFAPVACAEKEDFSAGGVAPGACIDAPLVALAGGRVPAAGKDPGQRPLCRCLTSVDVGMYDCCPHGCLYCYANTGKAALHAASHDPAAPLLYGEPRRDAVIREKASAPPGLF
jgi:hypothetical protein